MSEDVEVFLLGPMVGLSGGDMHALRLVDDLERSAPGSVGLAAPASMSENLPERSRGVIRPVRTPLDDRVLPMPLYMLMVTARAALAVRAANRPAVAIAGSHFFHDVIPCAILGRHRGSLVVAYVYHLVAEERTGSRSLRSRVSIALEQFSLAVLRRSRPLLFVDNAATALALEKRGFDTADIVPTENAYDPWDGLPDAEAPERPTLITIGRLTEEKGIWDAVEIARRLPDVDLLVLGDGPLRDEVVARVREEGLDRVRLFGFVNEVEKWRALRSAHAFLAPSREEGWGIAVGEALTAGLPVAAYDLPAYAHFGERFARVPVGDVEALTAAARDALAAPPADAAGLPRWADILRSEGEAIAARSSSLGIVRETEKFESSYWTADSQYRKFEDYEQAITALRAWYAGFMRMIAGELPAPSRHVDAGCGHGAIVYELLDRGWDAHGFDLSEWIIEQAREANPDARKRFAAGELAAVPFEGAFDLITCLEVLEHVPDPVASLAALKERLRPGGRLIATTPNLRPLMPWGDPLTSDPTHINVHEASWWRSAVAAAGLEPRRVSTFISVPLLWRAHPLLSRWIPLGERTGPGVLIVADAPRS